MAKELIVPVILCGGSGTRLWPASRENHPKQFLSLMNDFSLLQNTMRRTLRACNADASCLVTVTLGSMKRAVIDQLAEIDAAATNHILCEPSARNTAAAVAFAADYVRILRSHVAVRGVVRKNFQRFRPSRRGNCVAPAEFVETVCRHVR